MKLRVLIVLIMFLAVLPPPAISQQAAKPMSKDQIMSVVTAGMDNADLAKKIEERGIDFDLTDDYLQALRKAGAQEVVIQALRTVKPRPMSRDQLLLLVASGVPIERATALVKQRGIDFMPDEKLMESLRTAGADEALLAVVREAMPVEVQRHLARAAECEQNHTWAEAEKEYRAALALAPGNAEILQKAERAAQHQKPPQFKRVKTFHGGSDCGGTQTIISSDARWVAWSQCKSVDLWEVATGEKRSFPPGEGYAAFSPDGRWLAARAKDFKGVGVWEVATGREVGRLPAADFYARSLQFSPDGRLLALGGSDGTVRLREVASGKEVFTVTALTDAPRGDLFDRWVYWVAFSPDGRLLASPGDGGTIKLWETNTGKEVRTVASHQGTRVYRATFSPDGRLLASKGADLTVKLWDVTTGREVRTLVSGKRGEEDFAFTPDGDWLASGGDEGLTIWEVGTGRKVRNFAEPGFWIWLLGFSADGKWLATQSTVDVYLWQRQD